ncbi:MAG TPA: hypothetical protein VKA70_11200 [Blastocatellia bacterium]|nr:hypothetical protein [Blastocatellia bacterium]
MLDHIMIPVTCPTDWEGMAGDDRVRYCAECKKNVYNISKMTRREAEALIATNRNGFCARIVRNPDGAILTQTLPASLTEAGRRASPVAAVVVTAIIGISPNAVAHSPSMMQNSASSYAIEKRGTGVKKDSQDVTIQPVTQQQIDLPQAAVFVTQGRVLTTAMIPLRQLYERSDLVVVARASKSVKVKTEGEAIMIKTRFTVSSTHKGAQPKRAIDIYHWDYGQEDGAYSNGGKLLLFLKNRQNKGYEPIDRIRGAKELPEADLQIWLQRIDELAAMISKGSPGREEIVEWFVRCAEHATTRSDTFWDLERSADALPEEEPADASHGEDAEEATELESDEEDTGKQLFARLLTAEQRERLTQALLMIETIDEKDLKLINLVRRWDDGRLLPFLLWHLRRMEDNPPRVATGIIGSIAELLNDEAVTKAYDRYYMDVSYGDEDGPKVDGDEARQNRSRMLREFIALVESKLKK